MQRWVWTPSGMQPYRSNPLDVGMSDIQRWIWTEHGMEPYRNYPLYAGSVFVSSADYAALAERLQASEAQLLNAQEEARILVKQQRDTAAQIIHLTADLAAARAEIADLHEVLEEKRRLTRKIDVILHGEDGAAKQASLIDVIGPIKTLVERNARLTAAVEYYASGKTDLGFTALQALKPP